MKIEKNEDYKRRITRHAPTSPTSKNVLFAFFAGGFICFVGQWITELLLWLGLEEKKAYLSTTLIYILLAAMATALGFFDKIARHAGAGTLVPVTGFSNSVTSAAIDNRSEGFIFGVGAKIFTVAGPVILYATLAGTVWGFIYYLYTLFA